MHFFVLACCSPAECFFSRFRLRGNLGVHWYSVTHVSIPAELRGGAMNIQRRQAGYFFKGLRSASLLRGSPQKALKRLEPGTENNWACC